MGILYDLVFVVPVIPVGVFFSFYLVLRYAEDMDPHKAVALSSVLFSGVVVFFVALIWAVIHTVPIVVAGG